MIYEIRKSSVSDGASIIQSIKSKLAKDSQGLYVLLFDNKYSEDIWDSNSKPKIVVQKNCASIKPGKFETPKRLDGYEKQMRFSDEAVGKSQAFNESFVACYIFDLSLDMKHYPSARVFEKYWIEEINSFLVTRKIILSSKSGMMEWRNTSGQQVTDELMENFRGFLLEVANKILLMRKIISDN